MVPILHRDVLLQKEMGSCCPPFAHSQASFQQDSAPALMLIELDTSRFIGADLHPVNYKIRGVIQKRVYK